MDSGHVGLSSSGMGMGALRRSREGCWLGQYLCPTLLGCGNSARHLVLQGPMGQSDSLMDRVEES